MCNPVGRNCGKSRNQTIARFRLEKESDQRSLEGEGESVEEIFGGRESGGDLWRERKRGDLQDLLINLVFGSPEGALMNHHKSRPV